MKTENAMKLLVAALAAFCFVEGSNAAVSGRIIGGVTVPSHQYPYAAAVDVQTSDGRYFCGGTLYTSQYIITAGQCVYGALMFTIHLGSSSLNDSTRVVLSTSDYVVHPEYNPLSFDNDIGLIKLRLPVQFTTFIRPVNYLAIEALPQARRVTAIGWGQVSDQDPALSNDLQAVYVIPLSNAECTQIYGPQVNENIVCVEGNLNEGACHGDTGSPLIDIYNRYHTVIVGIAIFVSSNGCESTDPSGYTRVFPYVEWIQNVTSTE